MLATLCMPPYAVIKIIMQHPNPRCLKPWNNRNALHIHTKLGQYSYKVSQYS